MRVDTPTVPVPPQAHRLVAKAGRLVRGGDAMRPQAAVVGIRPLPVDGMPVVGWGPGHGGLYVVVTHSGITLAPLLGELVSVEVGGTDEPLLEPYRPARFAAVGR